LLNARHTAKLTRSHGYQGSTPTAFMTHTAPAIRLAPNKHNKQRERDTFLWEVSYTNESLTGGTNEMAREKSVKFNEVKC